MPKLTLEKPKLKTVNYNDIPVGVLFKNNNGAPPLNIRLKVSTGFVQLATGAFFEHRQSDSNGDYQILEQSVTLTN